MVTEKGIEALIKKNKVKLSQMPSFIHGLIISELEDSGDDNFRQGKEEGRAEVLSEHEYFEDTQEEVVINKLTALFVVSLFESCKTLEDFQRVYKDQEIEYIRNL